MHVALLLQQKAKMLIYQGYTKRSKDVWVKKKVIQGSSMQQGWAHVDLNVELKLQWKEVLAVLPLPPHQIDNWWDMKQAS